MVRTCLMILMMVLACVKPANAVNSAQQSVGFGRGLIIVLVNLCGLAERGWMYKSPASNARPLDSAL